MNKKLIFGFGNAKLSKAIATFSIPAGHTCPFAKECLSKANRVTGRIKDGKHCRFRCFAASQETVWSSVRKARWTNLDLLRKANGIENMANLIQQSLPFGVTIVRIHVAGDFYSEKYFLAWLNVALNNPMTLFYAYTKSLPFWIKYKKYLPHNFRLTASKGGKCDNLICKRHLKYAEVVFSTEEARRKGLEIDHDDSHCFGGKDSFCLLIHGTQPPKTDASKAWRALINQGVGGYTKEKKTLRIEKPVKIMVKYIPYLGKKSLTFNQRRV
jgi:hypothetical protein